MMKIQANRGMLLAVAMLAVLGTVGCISPAVLAEQAGFLSGTGYLVANTPPADEVAAVKKVLGKVSAYTDKLDDKNTFASLYGPISREVVDEFSGSKRILALGIARAVLDALDTLFLANPAWRKRKDQVADIAKSFVRGADRAFDLFARDADVRASILKVKSISARAYGRVRLTPVRSP